MSRLVTQMSPRAKASLEESRLALTAPDLQRTTFKQLTKNTLSRNQWGLIQINLKQPIISVNLKLLYRRNPRARQLRTLTKWPRWTSSSSSKRPSNRLCPLEC